MPLVIHCPHCSTRYQVADGVAGKNVNCRKCGNTFTATASAAALAAAPPPPLPPSVNPLDPLAGGNPMSWPAQAPPPFAGGGNPMGTPPWGMPPSGTPAFSAPAWNQGASAPRRTVSNPSGGPTNGQMRLVCCGMLAMGLLLSVASFFMEAATGTVYLAVLVLVPLTLVLGIAGLISPDVVRAMGKYGGHLPFRYKAIGWGLMGLAFLLMIVITIAVFAGGFRPMRPGGGGGGGPGLTRSQTDAVLERIRASHAASPNANTVRTVSFPVFATRRQDGEAEAERVLGPVAGYVAGSFHLSADRKKATFQYRGDKEIAIQYALLLPGPTGIYVEFTPEFAE